MIYNVEEMLLLEKMQKSKKTEDNSVKIGSGTIFKGDAAIGKNAKIDKSTHNHKHIQDHNEEDGISMASLANMAIKEIELLAKS